MALFKYSICILALLLIHLSGFLCLGQTQIPVEFLPNPSIGPGGSVFQDSPHFRVFDPPPNVTATTSLLNSLEAAFTCFVTDLSWRSPGLSFNIDNDDAPNYKLNIYIVDSLPGAVANAPTDMSAGLAYMNVVEGYLSERSVTVHEYGHALTYAARYWIEQTRTGAWWESVANFVADTYLTSPVCGAARQLHNESEGDTLIDFNKVISESYKVIVDGTRDTGNYYQAWPFLTYIFNNPDNYTGLGHSVFPGVWDKYDRGSNETPLHVLSRLLGNVSIQDVVGRYWARMAYVDIGHSKAQEEFFKKRGGLNYANMDTLGGGRHRIKQQRRPRYMGASILPLKGNGAVKASVEVQGGHTSTLAIRGVEGVRYLPLEAGTVEATIDVGEEASLVVANTPRTLLLFDPFQLTAVENRGLDYTLQLEGLTL